ncbi:AraC family transcriptional regulator [Sphingobium mellinum]|uniref:AraC family transcriptional regulator n=1 Tax=Sphingobium mellinum TaxID=1387166 RepID=UPI0030EF05AB
MTYPNHAGPWPERKSVSSLERFSTRLVPHQRRHLFWRDVVASAFPGMTIDASEGIEADLARCLVGGVGLARARSDRAKVSRSAAQGENRHLLLHILRRGSMMMTHDDKSDTARIGEIIVADDTRPYAIDISRSNDCLILQVPVSMMGEDIAACDWHGRLFTADNPKVAFLGHVLQGVWSQREQLSDMDDDVGALMADAARMVCRSGPASSCAIPARRSPVEYALDNLGNPDLGTALIGEALDLSARAVQKSFFRQVGLTPTSFITKRRLERATVLLARDGGQTITDIAFEVGFNDSAFFARCFRREFGVSPIQWRRGGAQGRPAV